MDQRTKGALQLVVVAVMAAALGLYAWFGVYRADEKKAEQKASNERLVGSAAAGSPAPDAGSAAAAKIEFRRVTVFTKGETTVLSRVLGKPWRVTAPIQGNADPVVVDGLVSQLQTAKFKATVEEDPSPEALTKFGLSPPEFWVEATTEAGATVRLEGGIENTFDGSIYLRRGGEKPIYQAEGGVRWALARTTFELREKEVLALEEPKLKAIALRSRDFEYAVSRNAQQEWAFTKPKEELADQASITGIISSLKNERAQSFPEDSAAARKALGFDTPIVDATFTTLQGETVRIRLARPAVDAGENLYALREESSGSTLAELQATASAQLLRNPKDLRDKAVVHFKKDAVTKVVFHGADGGELVAEKGVPGGSVNDWRISAPIAGRARSLKIASVLWVLSQMKPVESGEENPKDWAKYGLDAKARFIALYVEEKEVARFTIGREVPGKPKTYFVRGWREQVLQCDGARFEDFPVKVEDLLEIASDGGGP